MFGCITHQPRRNRPRNFEDEPPNLRSRSFDTPDGAESPPIAPKRTSRHLSLPAKGVDQLKARPPPPPPQGGSLRLDKWISHLLSEGAWQIYSSLLSTTISRVESSFVE
ncbi:hypothetical protein Y032_0033g2737 [Ancylostoma ceylanicum]|uniref:Uncharacterized protein n=1 Tax=Ancylostoma ceylanicum TaxID=53326 RepID=A0A016UNV1_9BILA|nr:hypothetical protein Y032_0033g2737 [Ancylostoma ceylanicum]